MKPHRRTALLSLISVSLIYVMPGYITATIADDIKEESKPIPLPAAQPQLLAMTPAGVQQGTAAEVIVSGRSLAAAAVVTVDGRGVVAELVPLPEGRRPSSSSVKIRLVAAADAEPGLHELRLRTPGGTSNVLRFVVGLLPEVVEVEPNNDDGTSERLSSLPVIVNGALSRGEDRDCFRFHATKGQTIVLDFCGQQLHPYISSLRPGWIEGVLIVRDAADVAPAADENKAAQSLLAEKTTAATRAAAIAKSRREAARKAMSEKVAAAEEATAKAKAVEMAADQVKKANAAVDQAVAALDAAQKNAATVAASESADADQPAADRIVNEKTAAVEAARKQSADVQTAAVKARAAQAKADQLLASLTASEQSATGRAATAAESARDASQELAAARTRASVATAALKEFAGRAVRNLAVASHFAGRYDPALMFTAPHDGEFVVEVRDDLYRGRTEFTYRLTVGELPFVAHTFPVGAKRGTQSSLQLFGVNLGNASTFKSGLTFAASLERSRFEQISTSLGPSNLFAVDVGEFSDVVEVEPNDEAEQATSTQVPATLNGIIERDGDFDSYRFSARNGQKLVFETVSQSFGSPLDARLDLFDERGRRLKANDDFNRLPDSRIDHTFTADGEYVVRVGDMTGLGSPGHVYRLRVREARPDYSLTVNPDNPRVAAGGSIALTVMIQRHDGFSGDVEVSVPNPPAGSEVSPAVINNTQSQVVLSLTMPPDAKPGTVPLVIAGRATIGNEKVTHRASPVERVRYINEWRYVPVGDLTLSLLPQAPFTLEWGQASVDIVAGKNLEVPVTLRRSPGFDAPVRITLQGLPSRVYAPVVTIEKDATEALVELRSSSSAPAGSGNAVASGSVSSFVQNSPALNVQVSVPEKKK